MTTKTRCDICGFVDGHQNLEMLTCETCSLTVHRECYGAPTYDGKKFKCWACRSVDKRFEIEKIDNVTGHGSRMRVLQKERPVQCALCSVDTGIHAMHPLYDNHGSRGRQIYMDYGNDREPELVWVHSLCAFFLANLGLTFGCTPDGGYDGSSDSENEDGPTDERPPNPDLCGNDDEIDSGDAAIVHHFVYYLPDADPSKKPSSEFPRPSGFRNSNDRHQVENAARDRQKSLKCHLCGKSDNGYMPVLRVPLQCNANDDDEYSEFQGKHRTSEPCFAAMHVGCARWMEMNSNSPRRVFFYPGVGEVEPVRGIYCTLHAGDVDPIYRKRKQDEQRLAALEAKRIASVVPRGMATQNQPVARKMKCVPVASRNIRQSSANTVVLPSLQRMDAKSKSKSRKQKMRSTSMVEGRTTMKLPERQTSDGPVPARVKKKRLHENLDRGQAAPVNSVSRPLLKEKRYELASKKSIVKESDRKRILDDLVERLLPLDAKSRSIPFQERKKHWKREYSELTTDDFKSLWKVVRKDLSDIINGSVPVPAPPVATTAAAGAAAGGGSSMEVELHGQNISGPRTVQPRRDSDSSSVVVIESNERSRSGSTSSTVVTKPTKKSSVASSSSSSQGKKKRDMIKNKNGNKTNKKGISDAGNSSIVDGSDDTTTSSTIVLDDSEEEYDDNDNNNDNDDDDDEIDTRPNETKKFDHFSIGPYFLDMKYTIGTWDTYKKVG